jgi:DNA-binding transcriptional ArsR family regulator
MGLTKSEQFTKSQNQLATIAKALGHPARIAIIEYLLQTKSCICGDIVNVLPLAQPTVSQHLKELKNAGIIKGTIEGTSICYCIDGDKWKQIASTLNGLFEAFTPSNSSCC